jgi:hypothetical protein
LARLGSPGRFCPRSEQHCRKRSHTGFGWPNSARMLVISSANSFSRSASVHRRNLATSGCWFCPNKPHRPFAHSFKHGISRESNSASNAVSRRSDGEARMATL